MYGIILMLMMFIAPAVHGAQCVSGSLYITITANNEFGIGENIGPVSVKISKTVFDISTAKVTLQLLDGDVEVGTRLSGALVNQLGEVSHDFKYSHTKSDILTIKATVTDNKGTDYSATKDIQILKKIDVKLTCDVLGYVNREVNCQWKFYDLDTNNVMVATSKVSVKQGGSDLIYQSTGSNGLKFSTGVVGSVIVSVEGIKDGYISDKDTLTVNIGNLQQTAELFVDNKDYFSYALDGISTGSHQLSFLIEESGEPVEVQSIQAQIRTPSSQNVELIFRKDNNDRYSTLYNFQQAGVTYYLSGQINFKDISKESIAFDYQVATVGSQTDEVKSNITLIIIGISVGLLLTIIIVVLLIRRK